METENRARTEMEKSCRALLEKRMAKSDCYDAWLQPRFASCDPETSTLSLLYDVSHCLRNPSGVIHGGAAAGMLTIAMETLADYVNQNAEIDPVSQNFFYERALPVGGELLVTARFQGSRDGLTLISAAACDPRRPEKICDTCDGVYRIRKGGAEVGS